MHFVHNVLKKDWGGGWGGIKMSPHRKLHIKIFSLFLGGFIN
jgi:hypothetical protein